MSQRCLVLGGSGYVGAEVCRVLAAAGARVMLTYFRNEGTAREVAAATGALALQVDLTDFASAASVVPRAGEALGGLDAIVQCVGTAGDPELYRGATATGPEKFLKIDAAGWDEMMDITARSTFAVCQAAARVMEHGRIVIVGSMDGVKTVPAPVHYAASKGALRAMVQAMAKALGERGILVNMIAPGVLDGGLARHLSKELLDEYIRHCSLKRTGTAREVADCVAWFALENTYVNGQAILLDGGL
jgi:3-oxoacyl-[acyl-carrier protein] reductase